MSWQPGQGVTCGGCGARFVQGRYGQLRHPSPWCDYAVDQAMAQDSLGVLSEQVKAGATYRGHKRSGWRRRAHGGNL